MAAINLPDTWGLIEFSVKLALTPGRIFHLFRLHIVSHFYFLFFLLYTRIWFRFVWLMGVQTERAYQSGDGSERNWQGRWDDYRRSGRARERMRRGIMYRLITSGGCYMLDFSFVSLASHQMNVWGLWMQQKSLKSGQTGQDRQVFFYKPQVSRFIWKRKWKLTWKLFPKMCTERLTFLFNFDPAYLN